MKTVVNLNPTEAQTLAYLAETDRALDRLTAVQEQFLLARETVADPNAVGTFIIAVEEVAAELMSLSVALSDANGRFVEACRVEGP